MIKLELVAHWRLWKRRWSTWLAGVAALLAGYLTAYPTALQQLVAYVPEDWRPIATVAVTVIAFAVPTLVNNLRQPKLKEQADAVRQ